MLNGAPQSESDPDSDSDEFGQEPFTPDPSSSQAPTTTLEHAQKQPSGQMSLLPTALETEHISNYSEWKNALATEASMRFCVGSSIPV